MNKYLEKVAEIEKEAGGVSLLKGLLGKVEQKGATKLAVGEGAAKKGVSQIQYGKDRISSKIDFVNKNKVVAKPDSTPAPAAKTSGTTAGGPNEAQTAVKADAKPTSRTDGPAAASAPAKPGYGTPVHLNPSDTTAHVAPGAATHRAGIKPPIQSSGPVAATNKGVDSKLESQAFAHASQMPKAELVAPKGASPVNSAPDKAQANRAQAESNVQHMVTKQTSAPVTPPKPKTFADSDMSAEAVKARAAGNRVEKPTIAGSTTPAVKTTAPVAPQTIPHAQTGTGTSAPTANDGAKPQSFVDKLVNGAKEKWNGLTPGQQQGAKLGGAAAGGFAVASATSNNTSDQNSSNRF